MRIGIIKLSSLGDVIHALPVVTALRRAFPDAELTWVVEAREAAVLEAHPDLDHVIRVDTRLWRRLARGGTPRPVWRGIWELRRQLAARRLDVAVDLQGLLKSGAIAWLSRAGLRIGFGVSRCREPVSALFTNARVAPPTTVVHIVEQYLALLSPLGVRPEPPEFHLSLRPDAQRRMGDFLCEHGLEDDRRLVALNPGAGRPEKRWPVPFFRELAERLAGEARTHVLIVWGPDEAQLAREIVAGLPSRPLLAPPTDLHELAALLKRVSLTVAGDTGPLHLAAALGTPALGLFGPTRAERNGPYGARCASLQSPDGRMDALSPARALKAAQELLDVA